MYIFFSHVDDDLGDEKPVEIEFISDLVSDDKDRLIQ